MCFVVNIHVNACLDCFVSKMSCRIVVLNIVIVVAFVVLFVRRLPSPFSGRYL